MKPIWSFAGKSGLACAAFAVLGLTATAAPSQAADQWVGIGSTTVGDVWLIDPSSPHVEGKYVVSLIKYVPKQGLLNRRYDFDYQIVYRVDDCSARIVAERRVTSMHNNGQQLRDFVYPQSEWKFISRVPGSVNESISAYACEVAFKRPAPKRAAVSLEGVQPADWQALPLGARGGMRSYYLPKSLRRLKTVAEAIVRVDSDTPVSLPEGGTYTVMVNHMVFDCTARRYAYHISDFYDASYTLVSSVTVEDVNGLKFADVPKNSVIEPVAIAACGAPDDDGQPGAQTQTQNDKSQAAPDAQPKFASGTAWLSEKGYVITASHVVAGATRIGLFQDGKLIGGAEVVVDDPANDVAVLKPAFDTTPYAALRLRDASVPMGAHIFTLGYPIPGDLGMGLKVTSGDINALTGLDVASGRPDDVRFLQFSAPVQHGNSGGPVFDDDGDVVGIVSSRLTHTQDVVQNANFALKARYVSGAISDLPDNHGHLAVHVKGNVAAVTPTLKRGVFLVMVETK